MDIARTAIPATFTAAMFSEGSENMWWPLMRGPMAMVPIRRRRVINARDVICDKLYSIIKGYKFKTVNLEPPKYVKFQFFY